MTIRRLLLLGLLAGCVDDPAPIGGTSTLLVFHASDSVRAARADDVDRRVRTRVEDFFPSACLDRDDDGDGIPNALDGHRRSSSAGDDRDAGVPDDDLQPSRDGGHDGGPDDDGGIPDELACRRCNRGPGTDGDFRLDLEGGEAELDRGRVVAAEPGRFTVASPDGAIVVVAGEATEVRDGTPAPGAEIRAEGSFERVDGTLTIHAERLEVLCPAPPALPDDEIPPEAQPIPAQD